MTDKIVILSTCETAEEASKIARALIEGQLAACVNIISGVTSVYRWKGAVETAAEQMLIIKTSRILFNDVQAALARMHSYELPECIALQIADGGEQYLRWIEEGLKQSDAGPR